MKLNPETLARASSRHPWRTVVVWIVVLAGAIASAATLLGPALTTDFDFTNNPEAKAAEAILEEQALSADLITETFVIAGSGPGSIEAPAFLERVNEVLGELGALGPDVVDFVPAAFPLPDDVASNPQIAAFGPIRSEDGAAVLFTVALHGDVDETADNVELLTEIRDANSDDGATVFMLGQSSSTEDFKRISEEDLRFGESIGVGAAIVVLLIVFGSVVAGYVPIVMGGVAIAVSLGIMGLLGQVWRFSFFAPNLVSMMGLAVGIDYALFIVSRNREERHAGKDKLESIGRSGATANRAVFFSGMTVVLALAGMLLVPTTIFRSLAGGAIIVVLVSVVGSMTLLPAALALLGDWVNWPWTRTGATLLAWLVLAVSVGGAVFIGSIAGLPDGVVGPLALAALAGAGVAITKWVRRGKGGLVRWARQKNPDGSLDTMGSTLSTDGGFWDRATRVVMGRPVMSLVLAAIFLLALSLPFWFQAHPQDEGRGFKEGFSGITTLPADIPTRQAFDALVQYFPRSGLESPARVVLVDDGGVGTAGAQPGAPGQLSAVYQDGLDTLTQATVNDPALGDVSPPLVSPDGTVAVIDIALAGAAADFQGEAAIDVISQLREEYLPAAFGMPTNVETGGAMVLVGGETAFVKDFFDISDQYTPWIIALVLMLSFVLLTIVFRSLVVPAKAIVMNLLSVGAAYGAIVLVFQKGDPNGNVFDRVTNWIGESVANISGFTRVDAIEAWLPLFLFSILFGLSMDYHVFLLTRIREEYDKTANNAEAVAYGLRTTGGIITGAAIIMVAVFSGFAAGRLTSLEQMGFGLAIAVFMDATIVRSILVPSTMRLLGDRNWYLPGWLQWLPKIDVEGHAAPEVSVVEEEVSV
ncbi:MAG: MMPL family transporter [Actinomycetota bacterium]